MRLSQFAKRYRRKVMFEGREVVQFPGRYASIEKGREIEIPRAVRVGQGSLPTKEEMEQILAANAVSKSELDYVVVQDLVELTGLNKDRLHQIIIYLAKHEQAVLNVNRWGHAVYIKFKV